MPDRREKAVRGGPPAWLIAVGALAIVGIVAVVQILGQTHRLDTGGTADTDLGIVTVRGWVTEGDETHTSVRACQNDDGVTIDLSALRVVVDGAEIEPSRSDLSPAGDGEPGCVEGSAYFPTDGQVTEVIYLSSPRVVWTDPAF
jgi:hypothetical protein